MEPEEKPLTNVVAYVETRLEAVDISLEIGNELSTLGATIENSIKKNVTHVIFREGTLTTWLTAFDRGLYIVSVGWIKFCKDYKMRAPENVFRVQMPDKTIRRRFSQALSPESSRCRSRKKLSIQSPTFIPSSTLVSPFFPKFKRFVTPPSMRAFRERIEKQKSTPVTFDLTDSETEDEKSFKIMKVASDQSESRENLSSSNEFDEKATVKQVSIPKLTGKFHFENEDKTDNHSTKFSSKYIKRVPKRSSKYVSDRPRVITRSLSRATKQS